MKVKLNLKFGRFTDAGKQREDENSPTLNQKLLMSTFLSDLYTSVSRRKKWRDCMKWFFKKNLKFKQL